MTVLVNAWLYLLISLGVFHGSTQSMINTGKKAAYKNHYKGTLYFQNKEYRKALQHFQKAYSTSPDNFYFGTSYAMSLTQAGKPEKGLKILQNIRGKLDEQHENYHQQLALFSFFEGMAYADAELFHKAVTAIRSSIELQEDLDNDRLLSLFYNAAGYATVLNQGKGAHNRGDIRPHYHVHTRDMLRALEYFEQALHINGSNAAAWYNYRLICDSLQIEPKIPFDSNGVFDDLYSASIPSLTELPQSILSAFNFEEFNEVLLMLDNSGSMVQESVQCQDTTRFSIMKETALELVMRMPDSINVGIGTIGGDCPDPPRLWHRVGELSERDMRYAIEFLVPDGTTPLLTMMEQSPELFSGQPRTRKTIFLVSDGANVCSAGGLDICEWVEKLASRNITIHILTFLNASFSNTEAFAEYTCLADKTNGNILYLDDLNCNVRYHPTTLVAAYQPRIPELRRIECWGSSVKNLWGIFPEK